MTNSAKFPEMPPPPGTPEKWDWIASEKEKWDALNAHMTPQFVGQRAYHEHAFAKLRCVVLGNVHACSTADPKSPEYANLFRGNSDDIVDKMGPYLDDDIKNVDPKLWDEMAEESDGFADTLRQCGVKVIRPEADLELPQGLINHMAGWGGPRFLSVYAGPSYGRILRNIFFQCWDNALNGTNEFLHREGTFALFDANPDLVYYSMPFPEPNISTPGYGSLSLDVASFRHMPNKHLLFGFGVPNESVIPKVLKDRKSANEITSAGIPQSMEFMMRMLKREGFTYEYVFFDSNVSYHWDCIMANMKEGVCGLLDVPNYGIFGDLPECLKDWKIVKIPVEEANQFGASNQVTLGDGRVCVPRLAKETIKRMKAAGLDPIPVKYDKIWGFWHSGLDCTDSDIWRENDPVKPIPDAPPPLS